MKKIIGSALIATMLAATGAAAQEIRPLETTASTQFSLPIPIIIGGVIVGFTWIIVNANDGS